MIIVISVRLEDSRIGRAWMAIREDEIAAKAMGVNTRNIKLLAFAMGASFGGVSGAMFAAFQGFISPESFILMESVVIVAMVVLGGMGHIPGVILGAVLLYAIPEALAGLGQADTGISLRARVHRAGGTAHAAFRFGHGADHAVPASRPVAGAQAWGAARRSGRDSARRGPGRPPIGSM